MNLVNVQINAEDAATLRRLRDSGNWTEALEDEFPFEDDRREFVERVCAVIAEHSED